MGDATESLRECYTILLMVGALRYLEKSYFG